MLELGKKTSKGFQTLWALIGKIEDLRKLDIEIIKEKKTTGGNKE